MLDANLNETKSNPFLTHSSLHRNLETFILSAVVKTLFDGIVT